MTLIHGTVNQAFAGGASAPLQPEQMIALLQAVAENQDDPRQMAWLNAEYPAIYKFVEDVDPALLLAGRTDPSALRDAAKSIAAHIDASLEQMRWDDLGLSPAYEGAARRLFSRADWAFIQDLPGQSGTKEPRFVMEEDAYRPLIPGQRRLDQRLFDWDMKNDLEAHLESLGVVAPDVLSMELGSFVHRIRNDYLHVPPTDAALLLDAAALSSRGERLAENADEWRFARRMDGENVSVIPVDFALGMRGVAYGLPDQEPNTVRLRCATRIAQRLSGDENAFIHEVDGKEFVAVLNPQDTERPKLFQYIDVRLEEVDGKMCVRVPTDEARVLLAPIALGDPAAKFSMSRQTLTPDAKGFDGENAVFLVQAAKLAYEDEATIELYGNAWGLSRTKLVEHGPSDGQAFVAYDEEKNSIVVSFRGTESKADVFVDADFGLQRSDYFPDCKVHGGFLEQFEGLMPGLQEQIESIREEAKAAGKPDPAVAVGGHSLGGALASMFTYWGLENDLRVTQTYTCGQPSWANETASLNMTALLEKSGCNYFRLVNNNDIVPRIPPSCKHCGVELYINHHGKLQPPGALSGWNRAKDRLAGVVANWSMSSGIDSVDSVSDHYVDFYLGYIRKNRAVEFAMDTASNLLGAAMNVAESAMDVARAVIPGGSDGTRDGED